MIRTHEFTANDTRTTTEHCSGPKCHPSPANTTGGFVILERYLGSSNHEGLFISHLTYWVLLVFRPFVLTHSSFVHLHLLATGLLGCHHHMFHSRLFHQLSLKSRGYSMIQREMVTPKNKNKSNISQSSREQNEMNSRAR